LTGIPPVSKTERAPGDGARTAAWVFLAWTAWALYWLTEPLLMTGRLSHVDEAAGWFREAAVWAVATLLIFRMAARFPLRRARLRRDVPAHLAAAVLVSLAVSTLDWGYARWRGEPATRTYAQRLAHGLRGNLPWYGYVLGIGLALHYHRESRERDRQAARLALVASGMEARVAGARFHATRMRMQPEFLYATLDAIAALAARDPAAADALTVRLADLLRMVVDSFDADEVPLADDAAYLRAWAAVQSFHPRGRLDVAIDLPEDASADAVPAFLLQPLAAALVHEDRSGPATVRVVARKDAGRLMLQVHALNGSCPAAPAALDDVRRRLGRLYGADAELRLSSEDAELVARVTVPVHASPATDCDAGPRLTRRGDGDGVRHQQPSPGQVDAPSPPSLESAADAADWER
jgi:hypothetical protein